MGRRFTRMSEVLETCAFLALLFAGSACCRERRATKPDPCTTYTTLYDEFLDVSYTDVTNNYSSIASFGWFRYWNTTQGSMSRSCPNNTQCGTASPVWLAGTPPDPSNGTVNVDVCFKSAHNCCASHGSVRVRNCKTFFVYFLMPQVTPGVRYCFDIWPRSTAKEKSGSSIGLIAGGAGGAVAVAGLAVGVVLVVRHKKMKANAVDSSKPDSNSAEIDNSKEKPA